MNFNDLERDRELLRESKFAKFKYPDFASVCDANIAHIEGLAAGSEGRLNTLFAEYGRIVHLLSEHAPELLGYFPHTEGSFNIPVADLEALARDARMIHAQLQTFRSLWLGPKNVQEWAKILGRSRNPASKLLNELKQRGQARKTSPQKWEVLRFALNAAQAARV